MVLVTDVIDMIGPSALWRICAERITRVCAPFTSTKAFILNLLPLSVYNLPSGVIHRVNFRNPILIPNHLV